MSSQDVRHPLRERDKTPKNINAAEWSLEYRVYPAYVGQMAAQLRARARPSSRERSLIQEAVSWAEGSCAVARQALTAGRPDPAILEFRTACELAPWDASLPFARAALLRDYVQFNDLHDDLPDAPLRGRSRHAVRTVPKIACPSSRGSTRKFNRHLWQSASLPNWAGRCGWRVLSSLLNGWGTVNNGMRRDACWRRQLRQEPT